MSVYVRTPVAISADLDRIKKEIADLFIELDEALFEWVQE